MKGVGKSLIQARLLSCRVAPKVECSKNPFTLFALTYDGSHCSHLSGIWPFGHSWLDHVVGEWFSAILALADTAKDIEDASDRSHSTELDIEAAELQSERPSSSLSAQDSVDKAPPAALARQHSTAGLG